jgi:hypothetical protein
MLDRMQANVRSAGLDSQIEVKHGDILALDFADNSFDRVVAEAAVDAKRDVRLVESRGHPRDHPVHPAMPETRYLTCLIIEVR